MSEKQKLALVFGGQNSEHQVSIKTAKSVFENLSHLKYEIKLIFIRKTGNWYYLSSFQELDKLVESTDEGVDDLTEIILELRSSDWLVMPLLHGKYGEDGTIQGFFEMLKIQYIGCGVLSSAVAMDKAIAKKLFAAAGLRVVKSLAFESFESLQSIENKIKTEFSLPIFIKPARQGSSMGVSKVYDLDHLVLALEKAFKFDSKILVEDFVLGREVECAVLGRDDQISVSVIGEIKPKSDFYDFQSKYTDGQAELMVPAVLPESIAMEIQNQSIRAFQALNCRDLARVDFFLTPQNQLFINEINTLPGFTSLSMYPSLWQASGLSFSELLDTLIANQIS